jgi:hypothetical protein
MIDGPKNMLVKLCTLLLFSCLVMPDASAQLAPRPDAPRRKPAFEHVRTLYTKSIIENLFVVGPDFHFASGFGAPDRTQFMTSTDSTNQWTPQLGFDPIGRDLFCVPSGVIHRYRDGVFTGMIAQQQVVNLGYGVQSLSKPRGSADRLYFMGARYSGGDAYWIFKLTPNGLSAVVAPDTPLMGANGPALPHYFPDFLAARGNSVAFDTSLKGSISTERVYVSWNGGPLEEVLAEGDTGPHGTITSIDGLEFDNAGRLMVRTGFTVLVCSSDGNIVSALPETPHSNYEEQDIFGSVIREVDGSLFVENNDALYWKHGNEWYRAIGVGDLIDGEPVTYVRYLDKRTASPQNIIVEVRQASSPNNSRQIEIALRVPAPVQMPSKEWLYGALDTDDSQTISLSEWQVLSSDPKALDLLDWMDTDRSGEATYAELKFATASGARPLLGQWMQRLYWAAQLDTDGNHQLSRAEIELVWKPGTKDTTIDRYFQRSLLPTPASLSDWLAVKTLPSFASYPAAQATRAKRRAAALELDVNDDNSVSREEFAGLFGIHAKPAKIDSAWNAATGTPKGGVAPTSITIESFVEAPKLPPI